MMQQLSMRLLVGAAFVSAALAVANVHASGPEPPVVLVEPPRTAPGVVKSLQTLASEPIQVGLQSDEILDIEVTSTFEDVLGKSVHSSTVGRSLVKSLPTNMSIHPDVIVARHGDIVEMKRSFPAALPNGVYSETVRLDIYSSAYAAPVVVVQLRFYRSTPAGMVQISSREFSLEADGPERQGINGEGLPVTEIVGQARSLPTGKRLVPKFNSEGRMVNAAIGRASIRIQSSEDESNEP